MSVTLTIYPGAGGVDAAAFARLLLDMYQGWAIKNGHRQHARDMGEGVWELTIAGDEHGWPLLNEAGVHRLVRFSPFDPQHRRHTSFAAVVVAGVHEVSEQIRSYVLDPYKRVTDHRTGARSEQVDAFMLGEFEVLPLNGGSQADG